MQTEKKTTAGTQDMRALLDVLPKERNTDPTGQRLAKFITSISDKRVPTSSFSRIWTLGSLQAKVTLGYLPIGSTAALPTRTRKSGSKARPILLQP
ncbi:hypothetical protein [Geotalea toluenoxydans]|uniref:hypothetical protein n=1 Tax=Geotalea toluenoxydans TaxID=421624 RepID=UPI000AC5A378